MFRRDCKRLSLSLEPQPQKGKDLAGLLLEQVLNYVFGLKENQKTLYEDVKLFIDKRQAMTASRFSIRRQKKGMGG
jgi:hypothetical protein